MSAESAMRLGRLAAERLQIDTAVVKGLPVKTWDEETSSYSQVAPTVYDGPCKVKLADVQVHEIDAAGQQLVEQTSTASFPVAEDTVFPKNFTVTVTTSRTDPAMVGRTFRITGPHAQTYATARRYPIEETS